MSTIGCDKTDVDCLIGKPANTINDAFDSLYEEPPCREGCPISPAVDSVILPAMLATMQDVDTVRRVPIMYGWVVHDGAMFVSMGVIVTLEDDDEYTMTSDLYETFWNRFRGPFETEKTNAGFDESNYSAYGSSDA